MEEMDKVVDDSALASTCISPCGQKISCPGGRCWTSCAPDCSHCTLGCDFVHVEPIPESLLASDPLQTIQAVRAKGQTSESVANFVGAMLNMKFVVTGNNYSEPRDIEFDGPLGDLVAQFGLSPAHDGK